MRQHFNKYDSYYVARKYVIILNKTFYLPLLDAVLITLYSNAVLNENMI